MNPADELRTAAAKLRDLAETAQHDLKTADYWKPYTSDAWAHGFINGFGGASSDYVAVLPPTAGVALADWLESTAGQLAALPPGFTHDHALAIARQINGTGGEQP